VLHQSITIARLFALFALDFIAMSVSKRSLIYPGQAAVLIAGFVTSIVVAAVLGPQDTAALTSRRLRWN
jgi:hypothetical protein